MDRQPDGFEWLDRLEQVLVLAIAALVIAACIAAICYATYFFLSVQV